MACESRPRRRIQMGTRCLCMLVAAMVLLSAPAVDAVRGAPALARPRGIISRTKFRGLTPQQLHAAYQLPAGTSSSGSQTIALIELGGDPTLETDLAVFDKRYGLPGCRYANSCLRIVNQDGDLSALPTNTFRSGETAIDVEVAHSICENCHLLIVEANPAIPNWIEQVGLAVNTAVREGATEVTICIELYAGTSEAEEASYLRQATTRYFSHPGVPIVVASGDCGYEESNDPEHWAFCEGLPQHYASFPSKAPTVITVGGTSLTLRRGVWTSSVWAQSGSDCTSLFAAPTWQTSVEGWGATGCGTRRLNVDVSADASPHTGPSIYDSTQAPDWSPAGWGVAGGTSTAAPIVASEFALAGGAHGVAYPAQTLYSHAGDGTAFEDVVEGSNGSCSTTACRGATGFDGPTGLGTPIGLRGFSLAGAPTISAFPTVSGGGVQGHPLTAQAGRWTSAPSWIGYQWEHCTASGTECLPIAGATAPTYAIRAADAHRTIRVMVTAGNSFGYSPPAFSNTTPTIRPAAARPHARHRGRSYSH